MSKLAGLLSNTREIWDLEDLDTLSVTHKSCRFYGTRYMLARPTLGFPRRWPVLVRVGVLRGGQGVTGASCTSSKRSNVDR